MANGKTIAFRAPQKLVDKFDELVDYLGLNKSDVAREMLEEKLPELEEMAKAKRAIQESKQKAHIRVSFLHRLGALVSVRSGRAHEPSYA